MKSLTLKIDNETFAGLEAGAERDGISINDAILDGIGARVQAEEEAREVEIREALMKRFPDLPTGGFESNQTGPSASSPTF